MRRFENRPRFLKLAGRLGRGKGRLRVLDRLTRVRPAPLRPDLTGWAAHDLAAVWIGHATVLLRIGGLNVLTDPVFSPRIGLGLGVVTAGPRRRFAPALRIDELPPIDLILVSHAHFDHLDRPSLDRLPKRAAVITSEHNADLIGDLGFRGVSELRWGESMGVSRMEGTGGGLTVTACEVRHWGARTLADGHRGYCGFMLEAAGRRVLFAGDTAYQEHFRYLGPLDAIIIGIGAYDPWIWNHADPEQAWAMSRDAGAERVIPVHHQTFRQSREPWDEPLARLLAAAGDEAGRIVIRRIGGQWAL